MSSLVSKGSTSCHHSGQMAAEMTWLGLKDSTRCHHSGQRTAQDVVTRVKGQLNMSSLGSKNNKNIIIRVKRQHKMTAIRSKDGTRCHLSDQRTAHYVITLVKWQYKMSSLGSKNNTRCHFPLPDCALKSNVVSIRPGRISFLTEGGGHLFQQLGDWDFASQIWSTDLRARDERINHYATQADNVRHAFVSNYSPFEKKVLSFVLRDWHGDIWQISRI